MNNADEVVDAEPTAAVMALSAGLSASNLLFTWLEHLRARFERGERPPLVDGPFGRHGVAYGTEGGDAFAVVGFCLPDGVYAESAEAGYGYGELCGLRIFYHDVTAETP